MRNGMWKMMKRQTHAFTATRDIHSKFSTSRTGNALVAFPLAHVPLARVPLLLFSTVFSLPSSP